MTCWRSSYYLNKCFLISWLIFCLFVVNCDKLQHVNLVPQSSAESLENNLQPSPVSLLSTEREWRHTHTLWNNCFTPLRCGCSHSVHDRAPANENRAAPGKGNKQMEKELCLLSLVIMSKNVAAGQKSLISYRDWGQLLFWWVMLCELDDAIASGQICVSVNATGKQAWTHHYITVTQRLWTCGSFFLFRPLPSWILPPEWFLFMFELTDLLPPTRMRIQLHLHWCSFRTLFFLRSKDNRTSETPNHIIRNTFVCQCTTFVLNDIIFSASLSFTDYSAFSDDWGLFYTPAAKTQCVPRETCFHWTPEL